jgi:hypothetical protein
VQVVAVHFSFDREAGYVEARPLGATPIPLNPPAVDPDPDGWSQESKERPTEPVVDHIAAVVRMFGACEQWEPRLVSDGRIVERESAGKKSVACDAVSVGEMRRGSDRRDDQE